MNRAQVLGGGVWILPAAIGAWLLIAAMAAQIIPFPVFLQLALFAALGCLFFARLRRSEYPVVASSALTALTLAQPAFLQLVDGASRGIWLSCGVYAIAVSAQTFARRDDARSVMQLGGALAAIQILDPLGSLIVAALLPGLFGLNRKNLKLAQSAGLYALVLFMPLVTALALLYLSRNQHLDIPQLMRGVSRAGGEGGLPPAKGSQLFLTDLVPLLIVAPVLLQASFAKSLWARSTVTVALIAGAISVAALIATFSGAIRSSFALAAAAAPLPLVALSEWRQTSTRTRDAIVVSAVTALLAWIFVL